MRARARRRWAAWAEPLFVTGRTKPTFVRGPGIGRLSLTLQRPLVAIDEQGKSCPRPWKNVSCDVGDALCFSAMTVETAVDRLACAA